MTTCPECERLRLAWTRTDSAACLYAKRKDGNEIVSHVLFGLAKRDFVAYSRHHNAHAGIMAQDELIAEAV